MWRFTMPSPKTDDLVAKIMSAPPKTITLKTPISEIAHLFSEGKLHHLPVVEGKKLIGMISNFDLMRVCFDCSLDVTHKKSLYKILDQILDVQAVMTQNPISLSSSGTVREAAEKLCTGKYHALPIVDDNQELIGIVTSKDLIGYLLKLYA